MHTIITGSSGFVGSNLIKSLHGYTEITPLNLREIDLPINLVESNAVIHLAGKAHDLRKTVDPSEYDIVNYELTKHLFDAFIQSDATKFVFVSSVKASADQVIGPLTEEDDPNPQTSYGKSKLKAELYIQSQTLPDGKHFYILRPSMIHGPGNKGNLNLLYKMVVRGIPYPLAAYDNKRSFLSIGNLCFVIKELLERTDVPSGVYNVADDEALSTNEIIKLIGVGSGKTSLLWKIVPSFINVIAKIGDRLNLPLTTERLNKLTQSYVVSNMKIKKVLKKEFPIDSRQGILITIRSFRS